ncbi:hypothetical protein [Pseudomonas syringae]|uniref:hypothetical protein n=1 Tax=Pseudomonas syringae TaxID=317 RepID=UPI002FDA3CE3
MKRIDVNGLDPQVEAAGDKAHRGTRIALAMVPAVGGALVEVFNSIVESPLTQRRWDIVRDMGEVINDLLDQELVTEASLQENDAFISTVAEACSISLRNHQKEKLDALKNAVRNSALPSCPTDDYRQLFLNFVDVCTVTHIRLLQLFDNPQAWFDRKGTNLPNWTMGSLSTIIELAMPELKGHNDIRDSIWKDLYQRGLVTTDGLNTGMSGSGMLARRTSPLGVQLIAFLS